MSNGHAADHGIPHPYHLVNPSPWPFVGALSAFVLTFGAVQWWAGSKPYILIAGFVMVLFTMAMWWREIVLEAQVEKVHTPVVRSGLRMGMILFIASEVMFFVAFNSAFLFSPGVTQWPPAGIKTADPWEIPFLNTLLLMTSGLCVHWAHHALKHGKRSGLKLGLFLGITLGIVFLALQGYEYGHAAFAFKDGVFPSVFYMATGFHGFHVFVGVCFLTVCLVRALKGDFTPEQHVGFEAASWYWHFVDVVWIFLFVWVYVWGA